MILTANVNNSATMATFFMKTNLILVPFIVAIALLSLEGCITIWRVATFHATDVSERTELWGDFAIGDVFETKTELFVQDDAIVGKENILVTPRELGIVGGMQYEGPNSVESYREDPASWPQVVGVLALGTQLRVRSIRFVKSPTDAGWTYPVLEILDGPFRGDSVNIEDLVKKCEKYDPKKIITSCLDGRLLNRVNSSD